MTNTDTMNTFFKALAIAFLFTFFACGGETNTENQENEAISEDTLRYEGEEHISNVRQLTFGGNNAEAYFSFDNKHLSLQVEHTAEGIPCDQIFFAKLPETTEETFDMQRVSTGTGRTTCAYFMPGDSSIIFASTHLNSADCPPDIDRTKVQKYVWPIYDSYEIFISDLSGNIVQQVTDNDFYDAEATVSPLGDKIVFTSTRDGDLDLYTMDIDGSNVQRVTSEIGYDGGAFFSADGSKLVFRASRFKTEEEKEEYKELLKQGMVAPTNMEVFVCNVDGSDLQQVTDLGQANWAPYFHPSGEKIIFSSNHASKSGRTFNLFTINVDGSGLEQITQDEQFDAFAMFTSDGKKIVWASNRNNGGTRDTNVFIADWTD